MSYVGMVFVVHPQHNVLATTKHIGLGEHSADGDRCFNQFRVLCRRGDCVRLDAVHDCSP
jgi:hypothetical protein